MAEIPKKHGGARAGAGRKKGQGRYGEPTKAIRVPVSRLDGVIDFVEALAERRKSAPVPELWPADVLRPTLDPAPVFTPLFAAGVSAGFPSPADDYVAESLDLNVHLIAHRDATFFLRAKGHSMTGAGIQDGDLLVVDRSLTPANRSVVIAVVDGEFTVKRLSKRGGKIRLLAENPDFAAIDFKDGQELQIWGVVTNVIHRMQP